jgi:hypothetical protein
MLQKVQYKKQNKQMADKEGVDVKRIHIIEMPILVKSSGHP